VQALLVLVRALAAIHPDVCFTVYEGARIQPVLSLAKCVGPRQVSRHCGCACRGRGREREREDACATLRCSISQDACVMHVI